MNPAAPNGTPVGDSGGGGAAGAGSGGDLPSGSAATDAEKGQLEKPATRLAQAKTECKAILEGVWGTANFTDFSTGVMLAGYACRFKLTNTPGNSATSVL